MEQKNHEDEQGSPEEQEYREDEQELPEEQVRPNEMEQQNVEDEQELPEEQVDEMEQQNVEDEHEMSEEQIRETNRLYRSLMEQKGDQEKRPAEPVHELNLASWTFKCENKCLCEAPLHSHILVRRLGYRDVPILRNLEKKSWICIYPKCDFSSEELTELQKHCEEEDHDLPQSAVSLVRVPHENVHLKNRDYDQNGRLSCEFENRGFHMVVMSCLCGKEDIGAIVCSDKIGENGENREDVTNSMEELIPQLEVQRRAAKRIKEQADRCMKKVGKEKPGVPKKDVKPKKPEKGAVASGKASSSSLKSSKSKEPETKGTQKQRRTFTSTGAVKTSKQEQNINDIPKSKLTDPLYCRKCAMQVSDKSRRRNHALSHLPPHWRCPVCQKLQTRKNDIDRHMEKNHPKQKAKGGTAELICSEKEFNERIENMMAECFFGLKKAGEGTSTSSVVVEKGRGNGEEVEQSKSGTKRKRSGGKQTNVESKSPAVGSSKKRDRKEIGN